MGVRYAPDLMDKIVKDRLLDVLCRLLTNSPSHVWPAAADLKKRTGRRVRLSDVDVVVLPLARIGAPAGASGSKVFVVYFSHRSKDPWKQIEKSPPLVVKIGNEGTLKPELYARDCWPSLSAEEQPVFALPIDLDTSVADHSVLVSPFRSTSDAGIKLSDLWSILHHPLELSGLTASHWTQLSKCIASALRSMDIVHKNSMAQRRRSSMNYEVAFKWYLRNTITIGKDVGIREHIPRSIFGDNDRTFWGGRDWPNPRMILSKLIGKAAEFTVGPVHGDLHPKNIVLGNEGGVRIIDFGWVSDNAPICLDYILLDINIRATTLPAQLSFDDVLQLAKFLLPGDSLDPDAASAVHRRAELIQIQIWEALKARGVVHNWVEEYLVAFFLVAYGLLVYLDDVRNQPAFIAMVLSAGERVSETILNGKR